MGNQPGLDLEGIRAAYVYLLGRALVARQEITDLAEDGVDYNVLKHNEAGRPIDWVNPNMDVTNSEAWIAVDDATPAVVDVPVIENRYYTVQIIDEWGEVITNINQRNYPTHPHGTFALVAPGSRATVPDGAVRIEVRSGKAKLLARIELGTDPDTAVALQHRIRLRSTGEPQVAPPVPLPPFDNHALIGVEVFDRAADLLASAPDVAPVAAQLQARVADVMVLAADPGQRNRLAELLRSEVIPAFQRYAVQESGTRGNNWIATTVTGNYGDDTAIRTAANYVGIWANARHEVIYFVTTRDADGNPLDGAARYLLDFPSTALPDDQVDAYWSLSLVEAPRFVPVPNRLDRYTFNSVAPPPSEADGSLRVHLAPETGADVPETNWLPTPAQGPFSLTFRTYVPKDQVKRGEWFPPAIRRR